MCFRPMVTAVPAEKDKQVFHERPRSKVKISTPLDSDAEEARSVEFASLKLRNNHEWDKEDIDRTKL